MYCSCFFSLASRTILPDGASVKRRFVVNRGRRLIKRVNTVFRHFGIDDHMRACGISR